jgi:multidrug efflux pump subunit AcrA (membrane-fusion protein)
VRCSTNIPQDELPNLAGLIGADRGWSVKAPGSATVEGVIDEIGYLIDPMGYSAPIKGHVDNKSHSLRAGQFVTVSITLPVVVEEMSLPASSIVEEKGNNYVFVQPDANKPVYEQRRVAIVRRGHDMVHIRIKLTPEQEKQGFQAIKVGERVVTGSAIELKAILGDLKGP